MCSSVWMRVFLLKLFPSHVYPHRRRRCHPICSKATSADIGATKLIPKMSNQPSLPPPFSPNSYGGSYSLLIICIVILGFLSRFILRYSGYQQSISMNCDACMRAHFCALAFSDVIITLTATRLFFCSFVVFRWFFFLSCCPCTRRCLHETECSLCRQCSIRA